MIKVYGLFIDGRCVYVGRTKDLAVRMPTNNRRCLRVFGKTPTVRVLKRVHPSLAPNAERETIRDFKRLGQAELNIACGSRKLFPPKATTRNLGVYLDDFEWLTRASKAADRSRIRMMRHVIAQWKAGQPVLLTIEPGQRNGKAKAA